MRVYTYLRVRLNIKGTVPLSGIEAQSPEFMNIYASSFINYSEVMPRYTTVGEPGRMLIITGDEYYTAVLPLVEWKQQRGLTTEVKKISEIGDSETAVQKFIKNKYKEEKSLTYVLLVGDSDAVPTLSGGFEGADCDACYGMVAGSDSYPDLFVS